MALTLGNFPNSLRPYTNIDPFSYRAGSTLLERLERLAEWLDQSLVVHLNKEMEELVQAWATQVLALIALFNQEFVDNQDVIDQKIEDMEARFALVVEQIINSSIEVSDPVVLGLLNNINSESRKRMDALYGGITTVIYVSSVTGNDTNKGDTAANALQTFDAAFNKIGAGKGQINLAPGEVFPITKGYTLDVNRHTLKGDRSRIDASGAPIGTTVLTWMGSLSTTQFQPWEVFSGIDLYGGVASVNQGIGMLFNGNNTGRRGPSHIRMSNFVVRGFLVGIQLGDQSYCLNFDGFHLGHNTTGFYAPAGIENSGERISFINGTFFNSPTFIRADHTTGEIFLVNCSLDYFTVQAIVVNSSKVSLWACHVEFDITNTELPALEVSGNSGSINMYGGQLKAGTSAEGAALMRTVIENNSAWRGGSIFRDVMTHNLWNVTSGSFAGGTGLTRVENEQNYGGSTRSNAKMGSSMNFLADGSFSATDFVDDWFILADASTPTARITSGTNINATYSDAFNNDSGRSLRIAKTAGQTQPGSLALAVPMPKYATPHVTYAVKNPVPGGGGTVFVTFEAVIMRYDNGRPVPIKREIFGGQQTISIDTLNDVWLDKYMIAQYRMPAWATHILIVFNMGSTATGSSIYVDTMQVGQS